jgi:hypothetical protein
MFANAKDGSPQKTARKRCRTNGKFPGFRILSNSLKKETTVPDYSLCRDDECGKRFECYRYMAEPSKRQSYSDFKGAKDGCAYFFPIDIAPTKLRVINEKDVSAGLGNYIPILGRKHKGQ